jgi:hypothetical protein
VNLRSSPEATSIRLRLSINLSNSCQAMFRPSFHSEMVALSECPALIRLSAVPLTEATRSQPLCSVTR